jgi:protein-tyrosine phosphatase
LNLTTHGLNKFPETFLYLQLPPKSPHPQEDNLEDYFPMVKEFISHVEQLDGRVLVHCFNGVSRSAAVVLRYLIEQHELLLLPIFVHVKNCRPVIELSSHLKLQLAILEHSQLGVSSVQRHAGKVWDFYEWNK